ncbi:DUF2127 domain-containing protein [Oryzomonas japonica]|uniref:DUF2127 domain-containing protein n=2 Tax=Oryzomonas japonica TaxID=2603858 RepID=A0A7J4ZM97_9BACT|nr:DUF2127 domain-containing protein [Oryzomonas japonica]
MHNNAENPAKLGGLRVVALFEGAKGMIVLLTGLGILAFIHEDVHHVAEQLVRHLHINPARHYPQIFIDAATHVTDLQLWGLALSALCYAIVRFVEAFGLWKRMPWAEWFGLLTGGMYIPVELFEVMRGMTWPKMTVLVVNLGVVGYLAYALLRSRRKEPPLLST